jgi:hypothetical protein
MREGFDGDGIDDDSDDLLKPSENQTHLDDDMLQDHV